MDNRATITLAVATYGGHPPRRRLTRSESWSRRQVASSTTSRSPWSRRSRRVRRGRAPRQHGEAPCVGRCDRRWCAVRDLTTARARRARSRWRRGSAGLAGAGGIAGHFWHNVPKETIREMTDTIEVGDSGLVIVAINPQGRDIGPMLTGAEKVVDATTTADLEDAYGDAVRKAGAVRPDAPRLGPRDRWSGPPPAALGPSRAPAQERGPSRVMTRCSRQTLRRAPARAVCLPVLQWLPRYERSWLSRARDPRASRSGRSSFRRRLAYSSIAGVPVQYGLYAAFAALRGLRVVRDVEADRAGAERRGRRRRRRP